MEHDVLRAHSCCSRCPNSLPFYGQVIFRCMIICSIFCLYVPPVNNRCLDYFHLFSAVSNAAVNMGVKIPLHLPAFSFLGDTPQSRITRSCDSCFIFVFLKTFHTVFHINFPTIFCTKVPTSNAEGFQSLYILTNMSFFWCFDSSHTNRCKVLLVLFKEHKLLKQRTL